MQVSFSSLQVMLPQDRISICPLLLPREFSTTADGEQTNLHGKCYPKTIYDGKEKEILKRASIKG